MTAFLDTEPLIQAPPPACEKMCVCSMRKGVYGVCVCVCACKVGDESFS